MTAVASARTMDEILDEGRVRSAELLEADRSGNVAEVARLHEVLNGLTREACALWRTETTVPTTALERDTPPRDSGIRTSANDRQD